jgi:hypothetical protein
VLQDSLPRLNGFADAPNCQTYDRPLVQINCLVGRLRSSACDDVGGLFWSCRGRGVYRCHPGLSAALPRHPKRPIGIVVGLVDGWDSRVISCGKLDDGTDEQVDGDTVFEIGSDTKTFTTLLLQDMVQRGEMKLHDPVAKYLPESVKMSTGSGKVITLHHPATHSSGLPRIPDNMNAQRADNPYADFGE